MKRISLFLIAMSLFAGTCLKGQTPATGGTALNYTGLENKLKKSDAEIIDPKKNIKAKTWTSRAQLLIDIFNVNNDVLQKEMDQTTAKLFYKEPLEIQTSDEGGNKVEVYVYERVNLKFVNGKLDSWTETKKIHPDPLKESRKSIDEAIKVNTDGKADEDIIKVIGNLKTAFENEAVIAYEKKDFKLSYEDFIQILDMNKLPLMNNRIDTVDIYYAGRAALENKDYKEANRLFETAAANGFNDPYIYVFRKQSYFASGDTTSGVNVIIDGFNKFPENQAIMNELINYYVVANQGEEALKLIAKAKATDPQNASYLLVEGALYDKMGNFEEAVKSYKSCLELDANYFDANYNLGVLYFNKAVKIYEDASKISDNTEFEKVQKQGDEMLKAAIPFMQKANELEPSDRVPLETLKTIFYRLKMTEQYDEVVRKLSTL
jgi:tetratricopeptide (TPR) repeat protein